ncbi:fimbrial protein [Paraburkholderia dinghuensis]|uniref:Type 1 fimbrial protein n=1 Tax=Paraburkholderia dinghuensis TaxID=2305225 RepID=A0A3N6MCY5_9BURK|nr:fimbrial protein [Paraburkholderia dinghuensis]RQH00578.1 type 1 fimbrial protein [Paraburkholderia dinghuensis]
MKSNKFAVIGAVFAAAALAPAASWAADGTITIQGTITAQTCSISGDGQGTDFTVMLPTVSTSALTIAGATAGRTPFNIALTNCSPDSGTVSTYFEPGVTVNSSTGQLHNTNGDAQNVEVGLLNSDATQIMLGQAQASQNSESASISAGSATLNYYAQYVAVNGASTAGQVDTSVMYSMSYQ